MVKSRAATAFDYARNGDPSGTAKCWGCGHSVHCHFEENSSVGCVARSAPTSNLELELADEGVPDFRPGVRGRCSCRGFVQGALPYELTKHLEGLCDSEVASCGCGHLYAEHGGGYGCWMCPCEVDRLPAK